MFLHVVGRKKWGLPDLPHPTNTPLIPPTSPQHPTNIPSTSSQHPDTLSSAFALPIPAAHLSGTWTPALLQRTEGSAEWLQSFFCTIEHRRHRYYLISYSWRVLNINNSVLLSETNKTKSHLILVVFIHRFAFCIVVESYCNHKRGILRHLHLKKLISELHVRNITAFKNNKYKLHRSRNCFIVLLPLRGGCSSFW